MRIAQDSARVTWTTMGALTLGRTWRSMMRGIGVPSTRCALMYSALPTDSVGPRETRAKIGVYTTAIATAVFCQPVPSAVTTARASRIAGKANRMSTNRLTAWSTQPRKNPAQMPSTEPITVAMATDSTATRSEVQMPTATRAAMSRPNWSVPNQ